MSGAPSSKILCYEAKETQNNFVKTHNASLNNFIKYAAGYSWVDYEHARLTSSLLPDIDVRLKLTIKYLERNFTTKFGFCTEVSLQPDMADSKPSIPNIFDSALIIDILLSSGVTLPSEMTEYVTKILLDNRTKTGLWNYFQEDYALIPDDVDTAAAAVAMLKLCGHSDIKKMTSRIYDEIKIHEDGLVDVYFSKRSDSDCPVLSKWPSKRRVDLGVTANLLYLLNMMQFEHLPRLTACYDLLASALDAMTEEHFKSAIILKYAKNYKNVDVICFFISRVVLHCVYNKEILRSKLAVVIEKRLLKDSYNPISMACRILAGVNVGLLEKPEGKKLILYQAQRLLSFQNNEEFFFPKYELYNAHGMYYFGSHCLSTAFAASAIALIKKQCPATHLG